MDDVRCFRIQKHGTFQWQGQAPHLNPVEYTFLLMETKMKETRPKNKQQLKVAEVLAGKTSPGMKFKIGRCP